MVHRILVGKEGRQVEDHLRTLEEHPLELHLVQDVPFHEQDTGQRGDVPAHAGGQVIENDDLRAQFGQGAGEVGTDGPSPASDQDDLISVMLQVVLHQTFP